MTAVTYTRSKRRTLPRDVASDGGTLVEFASNSLGVQAKLPCKRQIIEATAGSPFAVDRQSRPSAPTIARSLHEILRGIDLFADKSSLDFDPFVLRVIEVPTIAPAMVDSREIISQLRSFGSIFIGRFESTDRQRSPATSERNYRRRGLHPS